MSSTFQSHVWEVNADSPTSGKKHFTLPKFLFHLLCLAAGLHKPQGCRSTDACVQTLLQLSEDGMHICKQSPLGFCFLRHPCGFPSPSGSGLVAAFQAHIRTRTGLCPSLVAVVQPCHRSCREGFNRMVLDAEMPIKMTSTNSRRTDFIKQSWKIISTRLSILIKTDQFNFTDVTLGLFYV